ncbi:hypothetical protein GGF37_002473, partial [Kickxella alabastrina]
GTASVWGAARGVATVVGAVVGRIALDDGCTGADSRCNRWGARSTHSSRAIGGGMEPGTTRVAGMPREQQAWPERAADKWHKHPEQNCNPYIGVPDGWLEPSSAAVVEDCQNQRPEGPKWLSVVEVSEKEQKLMILGGRVLRKVAIRKKWQLLCKDCWKPRCSAQIAKEKALRISPATRQRRMEKKQPLLERASRTPKWPYTMQEQTVEFRKSCYKLVRDWSRVKMKRAELREDRGSNPTL